MTYILPWGKELQIPPTADIQGPLWPDGKWGHLVQRLLNQIEPWNGRRYVIKTQNFNNKIPPMAVPVEVNTPLIWGIRRGHKASAPGLSPFAKRRHVVIPPGLKGLITVELCGSPEKPMLPRAYGGKYTPPLPWMTTARSAPGGKDSCLKYWQNHAYLGAEWLIRPGTQTYAPPEWFCA